MIEPDFGACEVRFLLPDIRLERSECTARTGSPSSTSYVGDAGINISDKVIGNKGGTNLDHRSCPRCLEYAHLGCSSSLSWW